MTWAGGELLGEPRDDRTRPVQVVFCGYCGARPRRPAGEPSRVCPECELGLLLRAHDALAPAPDDPFLVVDDLLRVRALSRQAEHLLHLGETAVVGHPLGDILLPADVWAGAQELRWTLVQRIFGDGDTEGLRIAMRPHDVHGVRYAASVGPCEPGPAAVIVLGALTTDAG